MTVSPLATGITRIGLGWQRPLRKRKCAGKHTQLRQCCVACCVLCLRWCCVCEQSTWHACCLWLCDSAVFVICFCQGNL